MTYLDVPLLGEAAAVRAAASLLKTLPIMIRLAIRVYNIAAFTLGYLLGLLVTGLIILSR